MKRPIHITAVPNEPVDLDRFVAALAAAVLTRLDEETTTDSDSSPIREDSDD